MQPKRDIIISKNGVTVLELVIVMVLIAAFALMISPSLGEWAARYRIKGAARKLADTLQLARLKAISDVVEYRVQLDLDDEDLVLEKGDARKNSTTWTAEGGAVTLPRGVKVDHVDPGGVAAGTVDRIFRPDGSAAGFAGTTTSIICLQNDSNDRFRVVICAATGGVRVTEGW